MASFKDILLRRFSFITPIKTIPSIVATPKRIMNPIPAEIPKMVPVIQSEINPPINAKANVMEEIMVSFIFPKLKYNNVKISTKEIGTTVANCFAALSLLSNSPAQVILWLFGILTSFSTFFFASAMVLPKSRPSILKPTPIYRLFPSR